MQRSSSITNVTGKALVAAPLVAPGYSPASMKMHWAGHAVEQQRHATHRGLPSSRCVRRCSPAEALGVGALLLGVRDRRDPVLVAARARDRGARPGSSRLRVVEEVLHRHARRRGRLREDSSGREDGRVRACSTVDRVASDAGFFGKVPRGASGAATEVWRSCRPSALKPASGSPWCRRAPRRCARTCRRATRVLERAA